MELREAPTKRKEVKMSELTFYEFLHKKEAELIKAIGENDWREEKLYFIDEILAFVTEWNTHPEPDASYNELICSIDSKIADVMQLLSFVRDHMDSETRRDDRGTAINQAIIQVDKWTDLLLKGKTSKTPEPDARQMIDVCGSYQLLKDILPGSHFVDIRVRLDGRYYWFEGDFIKQILPEITFNKEDNGVQAKLESHLEPPVCTHPTDSRIR